MVGAQLRGLDISSFKLLNPGQIVDYCIEYNNTIYSNKKENNSREATQADFDRF